MNKIFISKQIKEADAFTIKNEPVNSVDLMERAATACTKWIADKFHKKNRFILFAGPGNNGGDGWAIARLLAGHGYKNIEIYLLNISGSISPDSEINQRRLYEQGKVNLYDITAKEHFPVIHSDDILIEGLFGTGLSRPLEGLPADLVKYLNEQKKQCIISIDMPGGLFGEDNSMNNRDHIIKADYTLTFQFPKLSFFFSDNADFAGEWIVLPIGLHPGFIEEEKTGYYYISEKDVAEIVKTRTRFSHKGNYGHGLLISGSTGMAGAAILASQAALRSGIGLVTTHIPKTGYEIIQTAVPEAIISMDPSQDYFSKLPLLEKYNSIAIGPGLGKKKESGYALKELLKVCRTPLVIDADALNLLSENKGLLNLLPEKSILTPHPKEFERIFGAFKDGYSKNKAQIENSVKYKIIIILKGAFTSISMPDGSCYFNTTGNPGMATGGSGDVLTGILLSLLAQGYTAKEASVLGVFLHGFSADLVAEEIGQNALIATDIINNLGKAFKKLTLLKK